MDGSRRHAVACGSWRRAAGGAALVCLLAAAGASGGTPEPRSALTRPDRPGVVFVTGHLGVGGTLDYDWLRAGGGAGFLFRPQAASDLLAPLYDWNTGLVFQGDWRSVSRDRRLLGLGLVLRRYVRDRREAVAGASPFLGAGFGGAEGTAPGRLPVRSWLWIAEAGWETSPDADSVFFARVQWQFWHGAGLDYSGWSLQFGAGVPLPW